MALRSLSTVVQQTLRRLRGDGGAADAALLDRFVAQHDQSAFAELVRRHGPMVLQVCRRILGHVQDAEDAFQATFIVLARRAGVVRPETLAGWLHGVACRAAMNVRKNRGKRLAVQGRPIDAGEPAARPASAPQVELREILDNALDGLPEKYRSLLVLCYLEERSVQEVAAGLGRPEGTVKRQLSEARELLRQRLTRRGVVLSAAGLTAALGVEAKAALPARLLAAAKGAALADPSAVSPQAIALAREVLTDLTARKTRWLAVLLGFSVLLAGTAAWFATPSGSTPSRTSRTESRADWRLAQSWNEGGEVFAVAWSPDGRRLATGSLDGANVKVWDVATGRQLFHLADHPAYSLAFSPDGKLLASGGWHQVVKVWDAESARELVAFPVSAPPVGTDAVVNVCFSPDGKFLVSGSKRFTKLWEVATALRSRSSVEYKLGFQGWTDNWQPIGPQRVIKVRLAQMPAYATLGGQEGFCAVAWSADGGSIAVGRNGRVELWDPQAKGLRRTLEFSGSAERVYTVAFSPDGRTVAAGDALGVVNCWDVASGCRLMTHRHQHIVHAVSFSSDGRLLASGSYDGTVKLYSMATGVEIGTLPSQYSGGVASLAFCPGRPDLLALGSRCGSVAVWQAVGK